MYSYYSVLIVLVHTCAGHELYGPPYTGFGTSGLTPSRITSPRQQHIFNPPGVYQRQGFIPASGRYGLYGRGYMFPQYQQNMYERRVMMPQRPRVYSNGQGLITWHQGYDFPVGGGARMTHRQFAERGYESPRQSQERISTNPNRVQSYEQTYNGGQTYDVRTTDPNRGQSYEQTYNGGQTYDVRTTDPNRGQSYEQTYNGGQTYDVRPTDPNRGQSYEQTYNGGQTYDVRPTDPNRGQSYEQTYNDGQTYDVRPTDPNRGLSYEQTYNGGQTYDVRTTDPNRGQSYAQTYNGGQTYDVRTTDPNRVQPYEQTYNGGQTYDVSPTPTYNENTMTDRSMVSRTSLDRSNAQQMTGGSNRREQLSRDQGRRSGQIIMDRQGPHGIIRKGDIGAYGGMDGFPYLGGVCGGHSICKDGGRSIGIANGLGAGSLEEFNRRRRTGQNKDIRVLEEAMRRRPRRQDKDQ